MFDENLIENEVANVRNIFSPLYVYGRLKGKKLCEKSDLPKNRSHPRFYGCPQYLQVYHLDSILRNLGGGGGGLSCQLSKVYV